MDYTIPTPPYIPGVDDGAKAQKLPSPQQDDAEDRQAASDLSSLSSELDTLQVGLSKGDSTAASAGDAKAAPTTDKVGESCHVFCCSHSQHHASDTRSCITP